MDAGLAMKRIQIVSASRRIELKELASRSHQVVILAACAGAITGLFVAGFDGCDFFEHKVTL